MRIGILSDTHDHLIAIDRAMQTFAERDVAAVIHAGDFCAPFSLKLVLERARGVPVHAVYGNNDGERTGLSRILPTLTDGPVRLELGGRIICLMHGHEPAVDPALREAADVVISGHTHVEPTARREGEQLVINPGECCPWLTGTGRVCILDTETLEAESVVVIEQETPLA